MFERFTERGRRAVFFARYEATRFGSSTIEPEHLLLGLLHEDKNLINRFLSNALPLETIREEIAKSLPSREKVSSSSNLPFSNAYKRVLEYAAEEAEKLNHRHIGTEHLLCGILREEEGLAAEFLRNQGLQLDTIREELSRSRGELRSFRDGFSPVGSLRQATSRKFLVPDERTAEKIAVAIWIPLYGAEAIAAHQPILTGKLRFGIWKVEAGPLFASINMFDGTVISVGKSEPPHV